jgi:2-alkyl-3-oxoalkanoate reductase
MKVLVTGGSGFVGRALTIKLLERGYEVHSLSRTDPKVLGVHWHSIDLSKLREDSAIQTKLSNILQNTTAVFHTAAKVGMWGKASEFEAMNIYGTQTLLELSQKNNVQVFIYTSSPSVIASGGDLCNVNEDVPYPANYHADYPRTKSIAEQFVLKNHSSTFRTLALRPHLIFGTGDTNLIPTIIAKARSGKLKIIGSGNNLCDFSYIEDCIDAHLCALSALQQNADVGGQAYFISQGEPYPLWKFINAILTYSGEKPVTQKIPKSVAAFIATIAEKISSFTGKEPFLTRFLVEEMSTHHYFDISKAKRNLGYAPKYSIDAALEKMFLPLV